jgi:hypothetical protein
MSSPGELSYHLFVTKLVQKATSQFISVKDTKSIAKYFWRFMNESFKQEVHREAFWDFALYLKHCIISQKTDELCELWKFFDTNGKNMWENLYENSLWQQVHLIL